MSTNVHPDNIMESVILQNLFTNEEYSSYICPYISETYFDHYHIKNIISKYKKFVETYNKIPSFDNILHDIDADKSKNQESRTLSAETLLEAKALQFDLKSVEWLIDNTEKHLKRAALIKASMDIIDMVQHNKDGDLGTIENKITDALKISVKNTTGVIYGSDEAIDKQWEYYHSPTKCYPFKDWTFFNQILGGGCSKGRLHTVLASTNIGKTLWMANMAQQYLRQGFNVLYVSLEDNEQMVQERIDGGVLDVETSNLITFPKNDYRKLIKKFTEATTGKLVVKYYPTGSISTTHIGHLIDEVKLKEDIIADVVFVDYIGCLKSPNFKDAGDTNNLGKAVSEELRGIAGSKDVVMWTAVQINRVGSETSDPQLTHIAGSFAIAQTADYSFIVSEDTETQGSQYICKQVKSRYKPIGHIEKKWAVQVNKYKQKIWEGSDPTAGFTDTTIPDEAKSYNNKKKLIPNNPKIKWLKKD